MANHDVQLETMHLYRALAGQHEDWGGRLVLLIGAQHVHNGAASGVSIAGGATLAIASDAAAMKAAMRAGHLDFVVNSLDEALRALKNEVRQKRPLGVGLIADVEATLAEMEERGIQPDLRLTPEGCAHVSSKGDENFFAANDMAGLRGIDVALAAVLPAEDVVRRRWIERAPQFLREARSGGRWIWLREAELAALAGLGTIPSPRR